MLTRDGLTLCKVLMMWVISGGFHVFSLVKLPIKNSPQMHQAKISRATQNVWGQTAPRLTSRFCCINKGSV